MFTPRTIEHVNDPTVCGYNFLPYATLEAMGSRFGATVAGDFSIEWSRESYASQRGVERGGAPRAADGPPGREQAPRLDYSLLEESTLPMPKTNVQAGAMWV